MAMDSDERQRLVDKISRVEGIVCDDAATDGPMGSSQWRFTWENVVLELYSDRGVLGAVAGRSGGDTYRAQVWAEALALTLGENSVDGQVDFFTRHLTAIANFLDTGRAADDALRAINWTYVQAELGFGPDADISDPLSWKRRS